MTMDEGLDKHGEFFSFCGGNIKCDFCGIVGGVFEKKRFM